MLSIKFLTFKNLQIKKYSIFQKIILDGKSYKLHKKLNFITCRFNKRNKEFLIYRNIFIKNKNLRKELYLGPIYKPITIWKLNNISKKIRYFNTYTKRGLLVKNQFFAKRTGRISGYV